ncbi:hypothetical protein CSW14_07985, partial [Thermus scotoductus]
MKRLALGLNALIQLAPAGLTLALLLPPASAQTDLTLSPPRLELTLLPGASAEEEVFLVSGLSQGTPENIQIRLLPFALDPKGNLVESPERNLCPHLEVGAEVPLRAFHQVPL